MLNLLWLEERKMESKFIKSQRRKVADPMGRDAFSYKSTIYSLTVRLN